MTPEELARLEAIQKSQSIGQNVVNNSPSGQYYAQQAPIQQAQQQNNIPANLGNPIKGEGSSYNPNEHSQAENEAYYKSIQAGMPKNVGIDTNDVRINTKVVDNPNIPKFIRDPKTGELIQNPNYSPVVTWIQDSNSNPGEDMSNPVSGFTKAIGGRTDFTDYGSGNKFSQQGTGANPGQTTSFTGKEQPPQNAPTPKEQKQEIKQGGGNQGTSQGQTVQQPQSIGKHPSGLNWNIFDFIEAAAKGAGRGGQTALQQRVQNMLDNQNLDLNDIRRAADEQRMNEYALKLERARQAAEYQNWLNQQIWIRQNPMPLAAGLQPGQGESILASQIAGGGGKK